jgi:FixJ family two-component response regulator
MIYLIDDDRSVLRGYELFLSSAKIEFKSFENPKDFLCHFISGSGDLLVLDLNLPEINGLDLLKRLEDDGISIPVIVVTAFDDWSSRKTCKEFGVKAFLRKPVDGETLVDIIKFSLQS